MPSTSDHVAPPPGSGNPLGSATASEDQVSLALHVIASGMMVSLACFSLLTWGTLQLTWASGVTSVDQVTPDSPATNLMAFGTVGTVLGVALLGWFLLAPVRSPFRRFGVAMVGTLAGAVLSIVATTVARWALAAAGLLLLFGIAVALSGYFLRRTRAAAAALPSAQRAA